MFAEIACACVVSKNGPERKMLSKLLWCSQFVCFGLVEARWEKDAKVLQTKDLDEEKLVTEARAWCVWDSANTGGAVGQNLELTPAFWIFIFSSTLVRASPKSFRWPRRLQSFLSSKEPTPKTQAFLERPRTERDSHPVCGCFLLGFR